MLHLHLTLQAVNVVLVHHRYDVDPRRKQNRLSSVSNGGFSDPTAARNKLIAVLTMDVKKILFFFVISELRYRKTYFLAYLFKRRNKGSQMLKRFQDLISWLIMVTLLSVTNCDMSRSLVSRLPWGLCFPPCMQSLQSDPGTSSTAPHPARTDQSICSKRMNHCEPVPLLPVRS